MPFAAIAVLALATATLGVHADLGLVGASAGLMVVAAATVFLPWATLPRAAQLTPLLVYTASVALLMQSQDTTAGGLQPLVLIPIVVAALFYRPWESLVVVLAVSLMLALMSAVASSSDILSVRRGLLLGLLAGVLSLAIHLLRRRLGLEVHHGHELLRQADTLSDAARELHADLDPRAIAATAARLAAEMASPAGIGQRRGVYIAVAGVDGDAEVMGQFDESGRDLPGPWHLADHPHLRRVIDTGKPVTGSFDPGTVGPTVALATGAIGLTHGAGVPVHVDGRLRGVLGVAGRGQPITGQLLTRLQALSDMVGLAMANAMAMEELSRQAVSDPLTGAANRRGLDLHLGRLDRRPYAVLSVDLDGLKQINDTYGHEAGDGALATAARAMAAVLRASDLLSRTGGDEFLAVLAGADDGDARTTAGRMLRALAEGGAGGPALRASIGVASAAAGVDAEAVIRRADAAMYEAKRRGGMQMMVAETVG